MSLEHQSMALVYKICHFFRKAIVSTAKKILWEAWAFAKIGGKELDPKAGTRMGDPKRGMK